VPGQCLKNGSRLEVNPSPPSFVEVLCDRIHFRIVRPNIDVESLIDVGEKPCQKDVLMVLRITVHHASAPSRGRVDDEEISLRFRRTMTRPKRMTQQAIRFLCVTAYIRKPAEAPAVCR